jgi:UDP-N-acetyl-D-galactosamine dehydrogenase
MVPAIYDPYADNEEVKKEFGIDLTYKIKKYDAIVLAVAHDEYIAMNIANFKNNQKSIVYDLKSVLDKDQVDARL